VGAFDFGFVSAVVFVAGHLQPGVTHPLFGLP
jgi:hypothetical protein